MDDNFGEWVEYMGVASVWVSRRWVWLVGGLYGLVPCIGVVSGCCCKEVYRYPHNNY